MALGRPRFHVSLLFVVGAILLWLFGAANVIAATFRGVHGLNGNSAWIAGNAHAVVFGPPTLLAVGALYHWAPKIWGRRLNLGLRRPGLAVPLARVRLLTGMGYYLLGYNGAPLGQIAGATSYQKGLYGLAEAGGALIALGVLVLLADLAVSVTRAGPAAGRRPLRGSDPRVGHHVAAAPSGLRLRPRGPFGGAVARPRHAEAAAVAAEAPSAGASEPDRPADQGGR